MTTEAPTNTAPETPVAEKAIACTHEDTQAGQKCHACGVDMPVRFDPFGGAESFADLDSFEDAAEAEQHVSTLQWQLERITANIFADPDLTMQQKADAVKSAVAEFEDRIDEPETTKEIDLATATPEQIDQYRRKVNTNQVTKRDDGFVAKIRRAISRTAGPSDQKDVIAFGHSEAGGSFSLKEIDGQLYWIGIYSNAFEDKDIETISESAHKEFIQHCEKTNTWPRLELWHTDGTKFGQTKSIGYSDRFTVAIGTIDKGKEDMARRIVASGPLAMSHGFVYPRDHLDADGVYKSYRTYEISVLPAGMAANELTGWSLNTEEIQMFDPTQRDFFVAALGEDDTKALEGFLAKSSERAESEGVAFKDIMANVDYGSAAAATPPATPGESAPDPAPAPEAVKVEMPEAMASVVKGVNDGFEGITKVLTDLTTRMDAYEKDDGNKLATLIRPLQFPQGAKAASEDAASIVDGRQDSIVATANAAAKGNEPDPNDPLSGALADLGINVPAAG